MVNYRNSKIYKVIAKDNKQGDNVFIGSTTQRFLSHKYAHHVQGFRKWLNNEGPDSQLHDLFLEHSPENCKIVLIEYYPCKSIEELRAREIYWIESYYRSHDV
jgi:hypothetical protein